MSDRLFARPLACLALATALAVAGCNRPGDTANDTADANATAPLPSLPATLPMATGAPTPVSYAPPVSALPAARPLRTVRVANPREAYAYADDAYAFSQAVGNAPPDYGFDYQGTEPWAWQGYDQSRTVVEPVEGGYRYYYYRPGAGQPYFVRDPDYGYGYDDGSLAVIYSAAGAILPYAEYGPRLGYASRYLYRGEALYEASRANERRAVIAANWAARQNAIAASRDRWAAAEARQAGWQAYRAGVADQQAQHWAQEAARRDADAHRFATWQDNGFRSAPPPRAIPVAWQQAPWAQDQQRYRVAERNAAPPAPAAFRQQPENQRTGAAPQAFTAAPPVPAAQQRFGAGPADDQRQAMRAQQRQAAEQQHQAQAAQQNAARQAAVAARDQQQAAHAQAMQADRQQQQAAHQAQQAERQQRVTAERAAPPAPRPADRPQPAAVHVHRGDGSPGSDGGAPRDVVRPARAQQPPQHDDQRQQQQAAHEAQQAVHQEQAAAHQAQAVAHQAQVAAQHAAQAQHAPPAPHPAPAPHAAPAPHPAPAHPGGAPHGEHHG